MFVLQTDKRPGDATTSRGMAPKTELRRINTIRPRATGESGLPSACLDDRGMAMERVSVEVPAELVGGVRETVLLLYEATAESLQLALRAHSEGRGSPRELHDHRVRLAQLDGLLTQLGWPAAGSRQVSAPADLLHDALYGALIDAGERLAVTTSSSWRGEAPLERIQEAAAEVLALHRLLRLLESLT